MQMSVQERVLVEAKGERRDICAHVGMCMQLPAGGDHRFEYSSWSPSDELGRSARADWPIVDR